ncbi:hypothetical protein F511_47226 [Dorcoceras hygrometricum]|uniref:Uncharacterized protein n=1 Tax=Dorcoceras hygrometricum TaxID=472368 RepID=A0A2Z6ZS47_9LAMI|nr:hypothetical protein F511_47226 [Dorcoceras hygrometricum]
MVAGHVQQPRALRCALAARWSSMSHGRWPLLCASRCANDGRPLLADHAHWLHDGQSNDARICACRAAVPRKSRPRAMVAAAAAERPPFDVISGIL